MVAGRAGCWMAVGVAAAVVAAVAAADVVVVAGALVGALVELQAEAAAAGIQNQGSYPAICPRKRARRVLGADCLLHRRSQAMRRTGRRGSVG